MPALVLLHGEGVLGSVKRRAARALLSASLLFFRVRRAQPKIKQERMAARLLRPCHMITTDVEHSLGSRRIDWDATVGHGQKGPGSSVGTTNRSTTAHTGSATNGRSAE